MLSGTYKLSWVNEKAFQGHGTLLEYLRLTVRSMFTSDSLRLGPGGFGNFWLQRDNLSSKDDKHKALREHIFGRLRQPDYQNKDQAHVILMPRLSGDAGTHPLVWSLNTSGGLLRVPAR